MVQIVFRGNSANGHWFCASTVVCKAGEVNVFDRAYKELERSLVFKYVQFSNIVNRILKYVMCLSRNRYVGQTAGFMLLRLQRLSVSIQT